MKKWLPIFLICLITFISLTPKVGIFAYTENDYYNAIGSYMLGSMLVSGDSTELDFSNGDGNDSFLLALGEAIVTGDYTSLATWGLNTLENTVTDIKEFVDTTVYNINPDIYDFLYSDDNVEIKLNSGRIAKNLFVELSQRNTPTPQPQPDFSALCAKIGSSQFLMNSNVEFVNADYLISSNQYTLNLNYGSNVSYFSDDTNGFLYTNWNSTTNTHGCSGIGSIYLDTSNYTARYVNFEFPYNWSYYLVNNSQRVINEIGVSSYDSNTNTFYLTGGRLNDYVLNAQTSFEGLSTAINYFYKHFRNCNLYVDNVLWAYAGIADNEPIELGDNLTIINDYPARYYYPTTIYFDMSDLVSKIKLAIQQKDVLTYSDIEDLIYDVNGNLVVGVVNFYRTDYDVLASEQIPYYPKFYYDYNLNQYVQAGANMINISTEVFPRDVLNILITSGVILLFGYVIRRLLE